jgi:hypothetical protein
MTASKTPNLQLMSPVLSDTFTPDDFAATFGIIDQNPGVLVIPNQASRPTGWGAAQHGRMVWQADINIMWIWNQPSALVAGAWSRQGTKGYLGGAFNAATVSTTATNVGTAPTVVSVTAMLGGTRPALVVYRWSYIGNDPAKFATLNLFVNGSGLIESRHVGNTFAVAYNSATPYPPGAGMYAVVYGAPSVQTSVTFALKLRCQDPAVVGDAQGGGSSFIIATDMSVFEL